MSKAPRKNWRQSVVEELVKHIEAGTAPWQKPWDADLVRDRPHNPVSGIAYKGINTLWLEMQPYDDPRWMTYRQALGQDAQVRKGEKGTQVEYWKWSERKPKLNEAGRPVTDDKGNTVYETYRLQRPKVFYATVFNAEQIDGLEPYKAPELTFEPVKEAEKILEAGGVPILHDQTDRAFYAINLDEIHLPPQTAFNGQYDYYATALHELGHATGHKDRLAREFGVFGSEAYAREELRAEMASYMISTELGLGHYPERHAAYVGSWLKAIEDDPLVLFRAARDAEAIRTWVMEPEKRLSLELAHRKEPEQARSAPGLEAALGRALGRAEEFYGETRSGLLQDLDDMEDGQRIGTEPEGHHERILQAGRREERAATLLQQGYRGGIEPIIKEMNEGYGQSSGGNEAPFDAKARAAWIAAAAAFYFEEKEEPVSQIYSGKDAQRLAGLLAEEAQTNPHLANALKSSQSQPLKAAMAEVGRHQKEQSMAETTPSGAKDATKKRIYLDVPYEEKEDAKKLGARWDRRQKSWYVGSATDVALFTKWLPQEGETKTRAPQLSPQEEFAEALEAHGLKLKGAPQMDGKWHRVEVEGDRKGQLSGSYRGFLDGRPAGQIMNYKTGEKAVQWVATGSKLAPEELARVREEAGTRRKALDAQITAEQAKVAKRAYAAFMNAAEAPADHPYLQKKQVKAHGLKMDETGNLLVPLRDTKGFLWNLQVIREDGTKRFLKGGRKSGLMHVIGDGKGPLIIAEGYATAATLSEATGRTAAVAFDAGNLAPVAEALKAREPERALVIAADDDHAQRMNTGLTRAREAAEAVKAELIVPSLSQAEKAKGLTDFNDVAQARGMDALKSELALLVTKQALARSKSTSSVLSRDEESGISAEDLRKPLEIQLWTSF